MLELAGSTTVYLACGVTDLRKSYNGLAAIIKLKFQLDPYSRCMFAFCNRRRTSIKILQWDGSGFWILMKRLDKDCFCWPDTPDELQKVTLKEMHWLCDGLYTVCGRNDFMTNEIIETVKSCLTLLIAILCLIFSKSRFKENKRYAVKYENSSILLILRLILTYLLKIISIIILIGICTNKLDVFIAFYVFTPMLICLQLIFFYTNDTKAMFTLVKGFYYLGLSIISLIQFLCENQNVAELALGFTYIFREFPARVEIPLTESITDEMKALYNTANRPLRIKFAHEKRREGLTISDIALLLHSSPKTIQKYLAIPEDQVPKSKEIVRERQHQLAVKQKEQEIEEARQMALAGYPIEQIATLMHHPYKTIQNYLNPDFSITNGHYNVRIPGKLAPYEREVIELRSKGLTYPKIHDIICKKGYTGSVASLRMFMQKERTRMYEQNETEKPHSEYVQRKSLCQLVYKKLEDIGTITAKQYQEVLKKYPLLSELYALTKEFCNVLFSNNPAKLDEWINEAQKYDIPELQTFINGIKKDLTAVKNGIIYSYNNGLAEGSVIKSKL